METNLSYENLTADQKRKLKEIFQVDDQVEDDYTEIGVRFDDESAIAEFYNALPAEQKAEFLDTNDNVLEDNSVADEDDSNRQRRRYLENRIQTFLGYRGNTAVLLRALEPHVARKRRLRRAVDEARELLDRQKARHLAQMLREQMPEEHRVYDEARQAYRNVAESEDERRFVYLTGMRERIETQLRNAQNELRRLPRP
ncbi:Oidioi.mRNA.OKI2018_I69.chr2.g8209.t1.cds [Oikopleura dioica]|uniref:Oidioi.mRNA.OKI2018_I69.chr2.g8209.t1.cds n=1 Tax=Oikopleura dioica TaxID=34765 RepID=A0ABN7T8J4_OIKDI|nr:Oidioi.mRNA.OKI2018_I69.chr2.g8209.t1.cds [Oikopleura dioica]